MTSEHPTDLLDAYALGILDADEVAIIEAHLAQCAACPGEVAAYQAVAASLPAALAAASPLVPPPQLRARLLQAVQPASPPAPRPARTTEHTGAERRPGWARSVARRRWAALAAAVALVFLTGSLIWNVRLSHVLAEERSIRADLAERVGSQEVVLEVIDSPRTVKAQLRPPGGGSTAYGKLYTRPDLSHVVVMAARLPPAPDGQSYAVWLSSGGQTARAGVLDVNEQGFGLLVLDSGRVGPVYEAAAVTVQPADTAAPDGPAVIAWRAAN